MKRDQNFDLRRRQWITLADRISLGVVGTQADPGLHRYRDGPVYQVAVQLVFREHYFQLYRYLIARGINVGLKGKHRIPRPRRVEVRSPR